MLTCTLLTLALLVFSASGRHGQWVHSTMFVPPMTCPLHFQIDRTTHLEADRNTAELTS